MWHELDTSYCTNQVSTISGMEGMSRRFLIWLIENMQNVLRWARTRSPGAWCWTSWSS
jgi:hypothetical protein